MTPAAECEAGCNGLVIATPAHGGFVLVEFLNSLSATAGYFREKWGLPVSHFVQPSDSCITRARNVLVWKFLNQCSVSHFMFIDADIQWEPAAVERLIASGFDICCGAYPFKRFPPDFVFHRLPDERIETDARTGYWKIANVGTGFMMMTRKALLRMVEAYPETAVNMWDGNDKIEDCHMLFDNSIEEKQYWTEDYTFCRRWRAIGGDVWLDPKINLKHHGLHAFDAGCPDDMVAKRGSFDRETISAAA